MTPSAYVSWPFPVFVTWIEVDSVAPGWTLLSVGWVSESEASRTCPRVTLRMDSHPTLLPARPWMWMSIVPGSTESSGAMTKSKVVES